MKWLVVITLVLFACVLSKLGADNDELRADLSRSRATLQYLMNDRDVWMKSQGEVVQDALKICKGDFSPCPNGVRGIIENEPGEVSPKLAH